MLHTRILYSPILDRKGRSRGEPTCGTLIRRLHAELILRDSCIHIELEDFSESI
jgi:hypothetical protein